MRVPRRLASSATADVEREEKKARWYSPPSLPPSPGYRSSESSERKPRSYKCATAYPCSELRSEDLNNSAIRISRVYERASRGPRVQLEMHRLVFFRMREASAARRGWRHW